MVQTRCWWLAQPDHLCFGTSWSPDGNWILYQDCHYKTDPGHDWSDICIGRPDGSENRILTKGQSQWFAAAYGNLKRHGDGSNMPQWCPDGRILYTRKLPGSQTAWQFQSHRPDTDHFNRDYKPRGSSRRHRDLPIESQGWLGDAADAQRSTAMGLSRNLLTGRQTDSLLHEPRPANFPQFG